MHYKKKESELNHPNFVAVRLSDVELHLLDQSASALGISRSEFLRKVLTEKEIQNRIEIVTDMESLRKLVSEYGKIGSNLNQIARYFNSGGERSLAIESEKSSMQSLKEKLKELETADQNVDAILQMQISELIQQKTRSKEYER